MPGHARIPTEKGMNAEESLFSSVPGLKYNSELESNLSGMNCSGWCHCSGSKWRVPILFNTKFLPIPTKTLFPFSRLTPHILVDCKVT